MIDKNINYNKYFLRLVKDFDESTMLSPDLNGVEKPKLIKNELIMDNVIEEFCNENSISQDILFLAATSLALNKFNFSAKNLIFHENHIIFTTDFEDRQISIREMRNVAIYAQSSFSAPGLFRATWIKCNQSCTKARDIWS